MNAKPPNPRTPAWDIDSMFTDRWSPRALAADPLTPREVQTLFEAARWAPSCFNEQPWLFVYATAPEQRRKLAACLAPKNQLWAGHAPLLMFLLARRSFQKSGKENRHAPYDAGAAWMALALQARKLGLYAHAMAGFNLQKAYEALGASPEEFLVMAAIAVGRKCEDSGLPEELRAMESPNDRKPHAEVATDLFPLAPASHTQQGVS
ncbi:MAG: nitroreductase family protein [Desulfobacterales bacterium]|jgi:nitroreductase|nr:nitroreductase family protein [Desulfobacterales bacterium]